MKKKWTFSPKSNLCGKGVLAKASILLLFCFVFQLNAYAVEQQQRNSVVEARGKVVDAYDQPVIGATVMLRGSVNIGSGTDVNGNFVVVIPASTPNPYLVVSSLGKKEVEVPFRGQALTIKMEDDLRVESVVVQASFNVAKESFTGDARLITNQELMDAGGGNLMQAISNIDPSFKIAEDVMTGFNPNVVPDVTMRSSQNLLAIQEENKLTSDLNRPLFIQDQFRISAEEFMNLNENLVESITLLKDASATALYGADGANGVVVVTMKKPNPGELRVSYAASLNLRAADLTSFNMMNAREKLEYEKNAGLYNANVPSDQVNMDNLYNARRADVERGVDTYWVHYPVRTAVSHQHSLSVAGGDNAILYTLTAFYRNEAGGTKGLKNNLFQATKNLTYQIENFTFNNSLNVSNTDAYNSNYNIGTFTRANSYFTPYDDGGALKSTLEQTQRYFVSGLGFDGPSGANTIYNPLYDARQPYLNESNALSVRNNFQVNWDIIPRELMLNAAFGIQTQRQTSDNYVSRLTSAEITRTSDERYRGRYTRGNSNQTTLDGNINVKYTKTLNNKHQIDAQARINVYTSSTETVTNVYEGFTNPDLGYPLYAQSYARSGRPSGSNPKLRQIGAMLRGSYTYDKRFAVDATFNLAGSSQFREDKRYAPSWSVGTGWTISNERFLEHSNFVNNLRVKVNYGLQGTQGGSMNQAFTMYQNYNNLTYMGWFGMDLVSFGNILLEAEKTHQLTATLEFKLWNNRISGRFSAYQKNVSNRFHSMDVNPTSGFTAITVNNGKNRTRGIDSDLTISIIQNRAQRIEWSIGGNLQVAENILTELNNSDRYNEGLEVSFGGDRDRNPAHMLKVGEALSTNFVVLSKGIDPSTGREIFIDRFGNETFVWDSKDRQPFHQSDDKIWGNLNTTVTFKNWTLQAYMSWNTGGWVMNSTLMNKVENINPRDNADKRALYDRWQNTGDKSYFKRATDYSATNATSRFVMKNNRIQMSSINLRYRVPAAWSQKHLGLDNITLSGNVTDIFYTSTIKRERGINDPFVNSYEFKLSILF